MPLDPKKVIANAQKAQQAVLEKPVTERVVNRPVTTQIEPDRWPELVELIAGQYPYLAEVPGAQDSAGLGKNGRPVVLLALAAKADPTAGRMMAQNVRIHGSGSVVWTNLEPVALP